MASTETVEAAESEPEGIPVDTSLIDADTSASATTTPVPIIMSVAGRISSSRGCTDLVHIKGMMAGLQKV
jgi:hypothetical protein